MLSFHIQAKFDSMTHSFFQQIFASGQGEDHAVEFSEAADLFLTRDVVFQFRRSGAGTGRIPGYVCLVEFHTLCDIERVREIQERFAREADDDIGRE